MEKFDVVIVGAGPAGLFCAYELIENNPNLKICLLDKGKRAKNRATALLLSRLKQETECNEKSVCAYWFFFCNYSYCT